MSRHRRRTTSGAVAVLGLGAALGGCAAGFDAVTSQPYAAADGVLAIEGELRVSNILLVANEEGLGRLLFYATTDRGTRLDDSDGDELLSVSVGGAEAVEIIGETTVPSHGALSFQDSEDDGVVLVEGLAGDLGEAVTVTLNFREAGALEVVTVVVSDTGYYEDLLDDIVPVVVEPTPAGPTGGVFPRAGEAAVEPPPPAP